MLLAYLDRTADAETVASILRRDGAVAVKELAVPELADTVAAELRPQLDADGLKSRSIFNGDCPAWVDTPQRATWLGERGQVATIENAKSQGGC
jgi:hypothetical protein